MALIGLALGAGSFYLSGSMIRKRTGELASGLLFGTKRGWAVWMSLGTIAGILIGSFNGLNEKGLEMLLVFLIITCLSAVDQSIRKIPNELLVALLMLKIAVMTLQGNSGDMKLALIGMVFGFAIFAAPSLLKIGIGSGDIKYGAVAGFYLGIYGVLQSVAIMSIVLGIYSLYLYIAKRGDLKTKVPMGPSFSLGFFSAVLFPAVSILLK